jgi:uncharacterized membrane protein YkoI
MKINKTIVIAIVLFGLLISGLGTGVLLTQRPLSVNAAPPAQEDNDTDEAGDVEDNGGDEAGEPEEAVSPDQGSITADEAKAAAEAAYSGAKAVAVELENENGQVIYEVELDNGLEVIVDAGNGDILGTE